MTTLWALVVVGLAAWRLWVLAAHDKLTGWLRDRVAPEGTKRREWLECPYCAGFWSAAACLTVFYAAAGWPSVWRAALEVLAVGAFVVMVEHVFGPD